MSDKNETTNAVKDEASALLQKISKHLSKTDSALEMTAWLKKAESESKFLSRRLIKHANEEFAALQATTDKNEYPVGDIATAKKYTPRAMWQYPQEIAQIEADIKSRKKIAQQLGTATRLPANRDAERDVMFSINLNQ